MPKKMQFICVLVLPILFGKGYSEVVDRKSGTDSQVTTQQERTMPVHNYNIQEMVALHPYFENHIIKNIVECSGILGDRCEDDRVFTRNEAAEALSHWCVEQCCELGVSIYDLKFDENRQVISIVPDQVICDQTGWIASYLKAKNSLDKITIRERIWKKRCGI